VRVHLVDPSGEGGVYHHTVAVARALAAEGVAVELQTVDRPEDVGEMEGVVRRTCLWRFRRFRPRVLRRGLLVASWLSAGLPACLSRVGRDDVVHVQGWFRPVLFVPLFAGLRLRRPRTIAYSPHLTYSRPGRRRDEAMVRWMVRQADVACVFTEWDRRRVETWRARKVALVPFPMPGTTPSADAVERWRRRWRTAAAAPVVLFAGQLRPDKGLDLLVEAMGRLEGEAVLAVVGDDLGAGQAARRRAEELGVLAVWDIGYQPFSEFAAAVAAGDVVACPYRAASQSAVLALATALGRATVATDVGGLPERATVVVPPEDPTALAGGLRRALERGAQVPNPPEPGEVAAAYLAAYGVAPVRN
jgi:glycosyltransferase involved in cell wall biosynthesis